MLLVLLGLGFAGPVFAQLPPDRAPVRVSVVTFGPGDHPFSKFGHNALLIEDAAGRGVIYNFGTFRFDTPMLIPKFLRGRFMYWLSLGGRDDTMLDYRDANRTIEVQELDLTPDQMRSLEERLRENARPQNREYLYDHFLDNCSTRVRDAVDGVLGGRLRQAWTAAGAPARQSFRAHALRLTADNVPLYLGLHFGLAGFADRPMPVWNEAFLPDQLRDLLRSARIPGEGAGDKPLVKSERVVFAADRPPLLERPPRWEPWFAFAGLLTGGVLVVAGGAARRRRIARVGLGLATSVLGLFGLLGLLLVLVWVATNQRSAWANENILLTAPWLLALVVFGVGVARGRERSVRRAFWVTAAAAGAAALGLLLKPLPWFYQDNWAFVAFFLPLWTGLALGLRRLGAEAIVLPRLRPRG